MTALPRLLFIHDNFPAQFGQLAFWLASQGWDVTFASLQPVPLPLRSLTYVPHRAPSAATHPYAQPLDRAALKAQAFLQVAMRAKAQGYRPDVIVAHSGWGAGMFASDLFPDAAFLPYCEWWYRHPGPDTVFLEKTLGPMAQDVEAPMHERARNAPILMDLAAADLVLCPTGFQARQFPTFVHPLMHIEPDGIDMAHFCPHPLGRHLDILPGLPAEVPLITYATRGMEPHRGFGTFVSALPTILARHPQAHVAIAGENRVFYGGDALRKTDWKAATLDGVDLDPERVHFTGPLPPRDYLRLLQRSDAHVYLTVPFVLSWSMLEAMSVGCPLVLSDTEPVQEFAGPDEAHLVTIDAPAISAAVLDCLADPGSAITRGKAARQRIFGCADMAVLFPKKLQLLEAIAEDSR
jgi:glycosyltransferase involved in cell wall biosynthesis